MIHRFAFLIRSPLVICVCENDAGVMSGLLDNDCAAIKGNREDPPTPLPCEFLAKSCGSPDVRCSVS